MRIIFLHVKLSVMMKFSMAYIFFLELWSCLFVNYLFVLQITVYFHWVYVRFFFTFFSFLFWIFFFLFAQLYHAYTHTHLFIRWPIYFEKFFRHIFIQNGYPWALANMTIRLIVSLDTHQMKNRIKLNSDEKH